MKEKASLPKVGIQMVMFMFDVPAQIGGRLTNLCLFLNSNQFVNNKPVVLVTFQLVLVLVFGVDFFGVIFLNSNFLTNL